MAGGEIMAASRADSLIQMNPETTQLRWKKVKEIFHEALRHEPSQRDGFLDESCDGDTHLRIEVESLLISFNEAETFLEEPILLRSSDRATQWQFTNDEVISHYRIVEPIGAGGMAEVYLAEDEKLHRQVALKVLSSEVIRDVDRLRRFKREALAVSALNHPNILTIFEFDSVNGINLLASEFVKGQTLRETLRNDSLEISDAIQIAIQVVSALQMAHSAGVIHRDIKPENIMIREDGYVKVLDFGLAKLTGDMRQRETDNAYAQAFSQPGVIMGTATYMSPEQARSASIDGRTDIFSFGVVFYEMLAGRPPFGGDTTTDIIAEVIQKVPSNPSSYNTAVSDKLDRIINKCLAKDRNDRYQTASDVLKELKELAKPFRGENRWAKLMSSTQELKINRKRRKYSMSAILIVLLLVIGIAVVYWYATPSDLQ
jgi:serine/threonine protein kinase